MAGTLWYNAVVLQKTLEAGKGKTWPTATTVLSYTGMDIGEEIRKMPPYWVARISSELAMEPVSMSS